MPLDAKQPPNGLTGHALRNAHLRAHSLARAQAAPPLARLIVQIRAGTLGLTRLEFARRSGIRRGTLRDMELGVHTPTRRILQQFVTACRQCGVSNEILEEVCRLFAGPGDTLEEWITRLELKAGSPRELARRVGISPVTLWEYRRGNFPLPLDLLRRLCDAVGEDAQPAEALWYEAERRRFLERGYPEALAEFWVRCTRHGHAEKHLLKLGLNTATVRRLRYLELPPWNDVAAVARLLCRDDREWQQLEQLWVRDEAAQRQQRRDGFGARLKQLRKQKGISRRQLADLFGIGGKKPARIIKYIEEDGFYSAQAYPAGLAAILAGEQQEPLLRLWQERRCQFHRRHRPETRVELRLVREQYGFTIADMERILGYASLEYQRIERGVMALRESALERILQAIHLVGQGKVEALLQWQNARAAEGAAWQEAATVPEMITLLARREGGLVPLTRFLKHAGLKGLWTGRLRAMAQGKEVPAWPVVEGIGQVCGLADLTEIRRDWSQRYREHLHQRCASPLGVELRLLMAEVAVTPRAFSPRLGFNYSVLIRDLQRIDRDEPVKWFHVERLLQAAGLRVEEERWKEIHALWSTTTDRKKRSPGPRANGRYRPWD